MISVTHLDGRCEPLVNIKNAEIEEEVNGVFTLSFTSFFSENNPGYKLLQEESIVELDGHEFRIIDLDEKGLNKSVIGVHVFFDLIHHKVEGIQGGTRTAEEQAAFILNGSGWTWEVRGDIPPQLFLDAFGNSNAVALIKVMCETLQCERHIMPGRHIVFAKEIGKDEDFQYRSKYNIKDITRSVSTGDLVTAIKATGANGVEVEYRAPTWELYAINGKPRYADPVTNEEMTSKESLMEFAKQELGDRWMPQISIDVSVSELNAQGYKGDAGIGDRIWLIEDTMDLLFQTRIMKKKRNPLKKGDVVVTLSNVKQTFSDVLTEVRIDIDENAREYRSRIHQTNQNIELAVERLNGDIVEAYSRLELTAEQIRSEVVESNKQLENGIANNASSITQLASQIESKVSTTVYEQGLQENLTTAQSYADQKALEATGYTDSALSTVNERLSVAESSITQLADSITSKIDKVTYETGVLNLQAYADSVASQALGDAKTYAETKANDARLAAEAVARAEAELAQTEAEAYADGIVDEEEQARITQAQENLEAAKQDAQEKADAAKQAAIVAAAADAKAKADAAQAAAEQAAANLAKAEAEAARIAAEAHADGVVTAEEQARIQQAEENLAAAKAHAEQKAAEAEAAAKGYTDGQTAPLVTQITEAQSSITQLSNQISSKVSESVYLVDKKNLQGDISDLESSTGSLSSRLYSAESEITQMAGEITSRVSYTDFNGNEMMSRINQTATTIKLDASKIQMTGITEVANQLHIGGRGTWGDKSLIFSNDSGIDSWDSRSMSLVALGGNIYHEAAEVRYDSYYPGQSAVLNIGTAKEVIWGNHAPVARFG